MSCSWCTNRSSMVLMSLVKSPIVPSFNVGNTAARPVLRRHAEMFDCWYAGLTGGAGGCSCRRRKRTMEQPNIVRGNILGSGNQDSNLPDFGLCTVHDSHLPNAEAGVVKDCT